MSSSDVDCEKPDLPQVGPEGGRVHPEVERTIRRARGGGQPLDTALEGQMSVWLGQDFSDVRVHTGQEAHLLSRQLGATAFTLGTDIFFQRGAYEPDSSGGWRLIAHELAHVLQQCGGRAGAAGAHLSVGAADHPLEREADSLALLVSLRYAFLKGGSQSAAVLPLWSQPPLAWHALEKTRFQTRPALIQRSPARFISAARNQTHPLPAEGDATRPLNCHEAVLGWLLTSMHYPECWRLIREAAKLLFAGTLTPQFLGPWMWANMYLDGTPVDRSGVQSALSGDILCSGARMWITHSMAVVSTPAHPTEHRTIVNIRGLNNIGTFGQLLGSDVPMSTTPVQYDDHDRDVADNRAWPAGRFGTGGAQLFLVRYLNAVSRAARAFPWGHGRHAVDSGIRWHYYDSKGWRRH